MQAPFTRQAARCCTFAGDAVPQALMRGLLGGRILSCKMKPDNPRNEEKFRREHTQSGPISCGKLLHFYAGIVLNTHHFGMLSDKNLRYRNPIDLWVTHLFGGYHHEQLYHITISPTTRRIRADERTSSAFTIITRHRLCILAKQPDGGDGYTEIYAKQNWWLTNRSLEPVLPLSAATMLYTWSDIDCVYSAEKLSNKKSP